VPESQGDPLVSPSEPWLAFLVVEELEDKNQVSRLIHRKWTQSASHSSSTCWFTLTLLTIPSLINESRGVFGVSHSRVSR
jgi:hypothetical protein